MFKLRVIQASYGDCLILEFGPHSAPRYILVDGGPTKTYDLHLRPILEQIDDGNGKLELVMLSHVDRDHVRGLLKLMAELRKQRIQGLPETVAIGALWHNGFSDTIDSGGTITSRLQTALGLGGAVAAAEMATVGGMVLSISEGHNLLQFAKNLDIDVNPRFDNNVVMVDTAPDDITFGNLTLHVVGPTQENLDRLKEDWETWLDEQEEAIASGDPVLAANADKRAPDLSSIMVLAEAEGKSILLTGDGRSDHLFQGLAQAGLLSPQGTLHVSVLKLPHHGSDRNVTKAFFQTVTADKYVVSADGTHGNPDLATLIWIVEAAKERGQPVELWVTNETRHTDDLQRDYDPAEYGYEIKPLEVGAHSMLLELAP